MDLYLTDNGACYCWMHLGVTAQLTGRDLSGQPILPLSPADVRELTMMGGGLVPRCETCGREARREE